MIQIKNKIDCCGCNACGDVCAHGAITFRTDNEGFWYPEVDAEKCSDCSLCVKVCPMLQKQEKSLDVPKVYGAYTKDEAVRLDSTSGGIFSELATAVFTENGYVGGAIYNEDHTVSQMVTADKEMLPKLRSSKYLQSDSQGVYKEILKELKVGNKVLFCGTPCQIHALKNFINDKYQANLTTIDFICRGVNSPKVWLKYMEMLERQFGSKAVEIKAKNKKWGWHRFSMRVNFENGKEYCKDRYTDWFFVGYLQAGNFCRPSCYDCQFKGFPQAADITFADFWGIENIDPSMDQDQGTSLVVVNTEKGQLLFDSIKDRIIWKEYSVDMLKIKQEANTSLQAVVDNREAFFTALDERPFEQVADEYFPKSKPQKKITIMRKIWRKCKKAWRLLNEMQFSMQNVCRFIKWNYCTKQMQRVNKGYILPMSDTIIQMDQGAKIIVDGCLALGKQQVRGARQQTRIWLEEGAELVIKGSFTIGADSYIRVYKNSNLILHNGFFNENVQVTAGDVVEIGDGCAIGRDVVIRSYDGHTVVDENYQISKPIKIGNHVWIGQGASVLKGVQIGEGVIVAANAVVTKDVLGKCAVAGNPARVVKENVVWK